MQNRTKRGAFAFAGKTLGGIPKSISPFRLFGRAMDASGDKILLRWTY